jgi:hypothetical protein
MTPDACVQDFLQTMWLKEDHKPLLQTMESDGRALSWFFRKSPAIILCVGSNRVTCQNLPPWEQHMSQSFAIGDMAQVVKRLSHWVHVRDEYDDTNVSVSPLLCLQPSVLCIQTADFL